MAETSPEPGGHPILFFDGVCNLCNASVDFLMRHDRSRRLRFAPLQGETAARRVPAALEVSSVALWAGGRLFRESGAALRALALMGGPWRLVLALLVIPPFLRDGAYEWIARNRYRWFGERKACRMPTAAERDRFLP
jgi:predicted DCC family thiol-disulfide oxidoreductase YuxK